MTHMELTSRCLRARFKASVPFGFPVGFPSKIFFFLSTANSCLTMNPAVLVSCLRGDLDLDPGTDRIRASETFSIKGPHSRNRSSSFFFLGGGRLAGVPRLLS